MRKGTFRSFKIQGRREPLAGVILNVSKEWVLIKKCTDYMLDGFVVFENKPKTVLINEKYEKRASLILKKKGFDYIKEPKIPIDDLHSILQYATKKYDLIGIDIPNGGGMDVVKYLGKKDDKYLCRELTTSARWRYKLELSRKEITVFNFDNDYLNSLKLLL